MSPARFRTERGTTMAEVIIAVSLLAIVGAAIGSTLTSSMQATSALERQSTGVDELRVAVQRIEREFRSAECIAEPAITTPGGSASATRLRFETRANGGMYEVTYRLEAGSLIRTEAGVDSTVAIELLDSPPPFTLRDTARRTLDVSLRAQPQGKEIRVLETSLVGRNAWRDC